MAAFGVTVPMDYDTMAQLVDVKSKPGLHYEYQYGYKIKQMSIPWPEPLYNGCTLRVFIYNESSTIGSVRVSYNPSFYLEVGLDKTDIFVHYGDIVKKGTENTSGSVVQKGTHLSYGVRISDQSLQGLYKRQTFQLHKMKHVIGRTWYIEIKTGKNYLMSFHLYGEERNFPSKGLGTVYEVSPLVMVIGSIITVVAVFTGRRNETITISFRQDTGTVSEDLLRVPLNTNEEFKIIFQNTVRGWQLSPSFLGNAKTAPIARRSSKEQFTVPIFSANCYIKKISGVCGAIPSPYRA